MDSFIFSVNATFPIFLTMLLGMFLRHIGLMDRRFADYLNAFVFKVALPVLLFQDLATQDFVAAWDGRYVLFCFVATAASMVAIV
ncbi:MAG: AEC family transporter, partial [Atopobium sp.]|nr:AEC family transporter [Atopobium sp.]